MRIDSNTLWEEIKDTYDFWSEESKEKVIAECCKMHGVEDFYLLTISQLVQITNGNVSFLMIEDNGTAYEYIFVLELKNFVENYINILTSYQLPQSQDEKNSSKKCVELSFCESLLIFVKNYFNLHSFEQAEQIRLCDLLIAKKDAYNTAVFEKEMIKIQTRKR